MGEGEGEEGGKDRGDKVVRCVRTGSEGGVFMRGGW